MSIDKSKSPVARIWKLVGQSYEGSSYPSSRLVEDKAEILNPSDQTLEEALIEPEDAFVVEFYRDGAWIVDAENLPGTVLGPPPPLFGSGSSFFDKMSSIKKTDGVSGSGSLKFTSSQGSKATIGYGKSFGSGGSGSSQKIQEPGTLGLGNM